MVSGTFSPLGLTDENPVALLLSSMRSNNRLTPTMDINTHFNHPLSDESVCRLLERIRFTGSPTLGELSPVADLALHHIGNEELLRKLMQPGELLSLEDPAALLDACHTLPPDRRSALLPYLHKRPDYSL